MDPIEQFCHEVHSIVAARLGDGFYARFGSGPTGSFGEFGPGVYDSIGRKQPPFVNWIPGETVFSEADVAGVDIVNVPVTETQIVTARIVGDTYENARLYRYWINHASQQVSSSVTLPNGDTHELFPRVEILPSRDVTAEERKGATANTAGNKYQVYEQPFRVRINYVPRPIVPLITGSADIQQIILSGTFTSSSIGTTLITGSI